MHCWFLRESIMLLLIILAVLATGWSNPFFIKMLFRHRHKATLFLTFVLTLAVFLFFGAFQDFLGQFRVTSAIAQLTVLFPVSLAVMVLVFILLRMSKGKMNRLTVFLECIAAIVHFNRRCGDIGKAGCARGK